MRNIEHGEKVKDRYGNVYTASGQIGNTVYLEVHESDRVTLQRGWIHRAKCYLLDAKGEAK